MKTLIIFFMLIVAFQASVTAQQVDENTLIINTYFQTNDNIPSYEKANLTDSDIQSYVNLVQIGNENGIYIKSLQTGDSQVVNQVGNNNNYEYYNYYSKENSSLNVNQEGTLNSLQVFGENSLMKNAIINQKSDFQGLIIKNYTN